MRTDLQVTHILYTVSLSFCLFFFVPILQLIRYIFAYPSLCHNVRSCTSVEPDCMGGCGPRQAASAQLFSAVLPFFLLKNKIKILID